VNAGVNADDFPTSWGTFDDTAALILSLPAGCLAATFDISAAYRLTPIRPDQQNSLCIFWNDRVHVDRAVMFGLSSSAGVFGSVADMLVAIYIAAGFGPIRKWVDDFLVILLPHQSWTEEEFMQLTGTAGVPWSTAKLRRLASTQRYIGFDWDLVSKSVAISGTKLSAIFILLDQWLSPSSRFSARDAASLHGKLVHLSCIFPLIRPFLRSLVHFSQSFQLPRSKLSPPPYLTADLSWIQYLLRLLPNSLPLSSPLPVDLGWWGDASSSFGIGIVVGSYWAVWKWAPGFTVGPKQDHDIGWAEAVAVELGFLLALHVQAFTPHTPSHNRFIVHSDNTGVVAVINKGRSRSRETNKILKEVYALQARQRIRLVASYVSTRDNIADALSRGDIPAFLRGFPAAKHQVSFHLPDHLAGKLISW
jgi:hypothetical protein